MKPDYKLEFDCPIKIGEMPKCEGGFACAQCEKKVFDYTNMNLVEFEKAAKENRKESTCGIYKAEHIDVAHGNWRDGVTRTYRGVIRKSVKKKRFVLAVPFIAFFMMLVGCGNRHVCGYIADPGDYTTDSLKAEVKEVKTNIEKE